MKKLIVICILMFLTACSSNTEKEIKIQQIERDLSSIVNSNMVTKASSNPSDYLSAHADEFDRLVSKKQITIDHFLNKFRKSNENGLKEYVMAAACVKILGDKNPVKEWSSGREWYDKYTADKE